MTFNLPAAERNRLMMETLEAMTPRKGISSFGGSIPEESVTMLERAQRAVPSPTAEMGMAQMPKHAAKLPPAVVSVLENVGAGGALGAGMGGIYGGLTSNDGFIPGLSRGAVRGSLVGAGAMSLGGAANKYLEGRMPDGAELVPTVIGLAAGADIGNYAADKVMGKKASALPDLAERIIQTGLAGAAGGALVGGGLTAYADKEHRLRGALQGGLRGALVVGTGAALGSGVESAALHVLPDHVLSELAALPIMSTGMAAGALGMSQVLPETSIQGELRAREKKASRLALEKAVAVIEVKLAASTTKHAATRQVEILRELAQAGKWPELEAMSKELFDAGVLKTSGPGTNVRHLGSGVEALADLVVGGGGDALAKEHPVSVRKVFDQLGPLYSKEQMANKINTGRRIRNYKGEGGEDFAELYGSLRKTPEGARYTLNEPVLDSTPGIGVYPARTLGLTTFLNPLREAQHLEKLQHPAEDVAKSTLESMREKGRIARNAAGIMGGHLKPKAKALTHMLRGGRGMQDAAASAEAAYPPRGLTLLQDLHPGNVVRSPNSHIRVLDYTVLPPNRRAQWLREVQAAKREGVTTHSEQGRQRMARVFRTGFGVPTPPSALDAQGIISTGPKSGVGLDAIRSDLGRGSRMPRKVRGA